MGPTVSNTFYALQTTLPTNHTQLRSYAAALKMDGPVTTIPLPHFVHDVHEGWRKTQAKPSPTHPMEIEIDRAAYSDLNISLPHPSLRFRRIPAQQSCLDTGALLN